MVNIRLSELTIGNDRPFTLIAGPCALESRSHAFEMCGALYELAVDLDIPLIYKSSFDKANRTSLSSGRGIGMDKALPIFEELRDYYGVPVITDVHLPDQCMDVAKAVDILQIPAFLCRQTDLLIAAGATGAAINVKKGQFMAPWDMGKVTEKIASTGNEKIMLCERGASFGYNNLVADMRSLPIMAQTGYPVIFDATHSVQQPGGQGTASGGDRDMVPVLARAATAAGCAGLFMEVHDDPDNAPSDGPNLVRLADAPDLLKKFKALDQAAKGC